MSLMPAIVTELEFEGVATRKVFERIPSEKFSWKPHEKSMSFGGLASHVAESLSWAASIAEADEAVFSMKTYTPFEAKSQSELLDTFDRNLSTALAALRTISEAQEQTLWRMIVDGVTLIELPRVAVLRSMTLNHLIHHRGQLTVYLRLNDLPVPAIYGPTADEQG